MKKSKNSFTIAVVLSVVILFPAISLLVNVVGGKAGKDFFSELRKNLGSLPNFSQKDIHGNIQTGAEIHGNMILFSILQNQGADSVISVMKIINKTEQFREEVDNFKLITFYDSLNTEKAHQLDLDISAKDKERWLILPLNDSIKNIRLPNDYSVALIDTSNIIRHYYDTRLLPDKQMLVQHLALMPIRKKKDVVKVEQKKM